MGSSFEPGLIIPALNQEVLLTDVISTIKNQNKICRFKEILLNLH